MSNTEKALSIGLEVVDTRGQLEASASQVETVARESGYSFAAVSIVRRDGARGASNGPVVFNPDQLLLATAEDASFAIGVASSRGVDAADDVVRRGAIQLLDAQANWANHLGVAALLVTLPGSLSKKSDDTTVLPFSAAVANFARSISALLSRASYTQILLRIPLSANGWNIWNAVRSLCGHSPKLQLALEFENISTAANDTINQWMAEPVKLVILPTDMFLFNKKNYPVLSKMHQAWCRSIMNLNVQFLISSPPNSPVSPENGGIGAYRLYIDNLYKTRPPLSAVDAFARGYDDYLQAPLQPLMDNLESATYEVFEKDPVKYQEYENAIELALKDRVAAGLRNVFVVMVFGAGRGPLVDCALRAAEKAGCTLVLYALEKNPNAIVILQTKKQTRWGDAVTIVHSDMRYWEPPVKADILVSELLGSFGDNELSPECLDGAQKVLKPDGISIPESYTAFLTPISSTKLYNDVCSYKDLAHLETPYVVKFKAINSIAEPVPVWTFTHPQPGLEVNLGTKDFNIHNTRYSHTSFEAKQDLLIHGIAGYFESVLYRHIHLSINPSTHSPDMSSWFPIFFPLQVPLHVSSGSHVDVHFWRLTDDRKVWYEWACVPRTKSGESILGGASEIHNVGGRSSWIGL